MSEIPCYSEQEHFTSDELPDENSEFEAEFNKRADDIKYCHELIDITKSPGFNAGPDGDPHGSYIFLTKQKKISEKIAEQIWSKRHLDEGVGEPMGGIKSDFVNKIIEENENRKQKEIKVKKENVMERIIVVSILGLILAGITALLSPEAQACGEIEVRQEPIVYPSSYPNGYLLKHYTPCKGNFYQKGFDCTILNKNKLKNHREQSSPLQIDEKTKTNSYQPRGFRQRMVAKLQLK